MLIALSFFIPLKDTRPESAQDDYDEAVQLFHRGYLERSQTDAHIRVDQFENSDPAWAMRFRLLEAESMLFRGMYSDALRILASCHFDPSDEENFIRTLAIESIALARTQRLDEAHRQLRLAEASCMNSQTSACGDVLRAGGIIGVQEDRLLAARQSFTDTVAFARAHQDRWLEASASLNLGVVAMKTDRFDEALDWSKTANSIAKSLGAEDEAQLSSGNLGWIYHQLGDNERALALFIDAEKIAHKLGSDRDQLLWVTAAGYVYRDTGDLPRATDSYRQAYTLAKQLDSKEDIINALEDLAQVSVDSGSLDEAGAYIDRVTPMELAGGSHLSPNVKLTEGMLAAARHQDQQAHSLFLDVQHDQTSSTTTRLAVGYELALLFEAQNNNAAAEQMFKSTLAAFDTAQADLKSEESKLPFVANAARIYDDYIQLLVKQGRGEDALRIADESRARTLAQALDAPTGKTSHAALINPRQVAQKNDATLLFYWLSRKQSYLWTITPTKIALFPLPPQQQITKQIARYNQYLLNLHDPLAASNQDAQALYTTLVAPAAPLLHLTQPVMILADGALNQLNFETLLAPGPSSINPPNTDSAHTPNLHYLIEDATLLSAPSLAMLAAAKPKLKAESNLLLFGNPISASEDYPTLPLFGFEMTRIRRHFDTAHISAFDGAHATPAAYLASNPARYSYIHFVSHAVASRTDPLDSAIILSNSNKGQDSFKLYARDIMQHPINARLVTISACYGSGTRAYAGEGLVGLSWAFMRAGAQSVIGALWEVSDDSTPQMMDTLYKDLAAGDAPAVALRKAKLDLMHAQGRFRVPFYWAPFQIYTAH